MYSGCLHSLWSTWLKVVLGDGMLGKAFDSICKITREKILVLVVSLCGFLNCTYMLSVIGDGVGSYSVVQAGLEFPEYDKQATDS